MNTLDKLVARKIKKKQDHAAVERKSRKCWTGKLTEIAHVVGLDGCCHEKALDGAVNYLEYLFQKDQQNTREYQQLMRMQGAKRLMVLANNGLM